MQEKMRDEMLAGRQIHDVFLVVGSVHRLRDYMVPFYSRRLSLDVDEFFSLSFLDEFSVYGEPVHG